MKDSCVKENPRLTKLIFWGVIILFGIQFSFQIFTFFFYSEYKGGLINGRMLLWDGLQTWPVVRALLRYLLIHFMILTLVSGISALAARFLVTRLNIRESAAKLMIFNLLLMYGSLMVINLYHYPNSLAKLAVVSDWQAANNSVAYYMAIAISLVFFSMSVAELLARVVNWWRANSTRTRQIAVILSAMFIATLAVLQSNPGFVIAQPKTPNSVNTQPNIILIGLDSVRVDVIEEDSLRKQFLPNLDEFLEQKNTAWFPNSYTPIARTFAAWYALLAGKEPKRSGVRYNLQSLSPTQKISTIVRDLRSNGYYAIYGSDEKRFSSIDESFGFHETLGPPVGAAEWILSILEDTPIHNIFRDTRPAAFLFPHTYGNRASYSVHKPEHFSKLVQRRLAVYDHIKPLFLSIHLCLSHWPYTWSTGRTHSGQSQVQDYFDTLGPLDQQFGNIIETLQGSGLLQNSVVVVFTDHGEGLVSGAMNDEDPSWKDFRAHLPRASDISIGHGTDLLTITQNQILVSIQNNTGTKDMPTGNSSRLTSLLDITPTIARFAQVNDFKSDGIDLATAIDGLAEKRVLFLETGFNPAPIEGADLNIDELVQQGASTYEINKDGMLQIRKEFHTDIISKKHRGVTDGRFILSSNFASLSKTSERPALTALDLHDPKRKISNTDFESNTDLYYLRDQLEHYYADEIFIR